jgi:hypothetical protein
MVEFGDGKKLDIRGEIRIEESDGAVFIVGNGILMPVADRVEAEKLLRDMDTDQLYLKMKLFRSEKNRKLYRDYINKPAARDTPSTEGDESGLVDPHRDI